MTPKPPYRIPSMAEIAAQRATNGYRVVSTFSGGGGSCLGFEWAGYEIAWACEFIEAARECYAANHPGVPIDARDIRDITAADVRAVIGDGEIDVLEGSPPCASFSRSGSVERKWGEVTPYSETKQRTDDLFYEFARLLRDLQPRTFVAENVKGLVTGKSKGYFVRILAALRDANYRVGAQVLDASYLDVPQARQRVIFVGVRADLDAEPAFPTPRSYRYTLRDACPWIDDRDPEAADRHPLAPTAAEREALNFERYALYNDWLAVGNGGGHGHKYLNLYRCRCDRPAATLVQQSGSPCLASITHPYEPRKFTTLELRRIQGFPDDFVLPGDYRRQCERLGRSVPPPMMRAVAATVRDEILGKVDR